MAYTIIFDMTVNRQKSYHFIATATQAVVFKLIMIIISRHRAAAITLSKSSRVAKSDVEMRRAAAPA